MRERGYVYQRVNVAATGRTPHLESHLRIAAHAFERIYGHSPTLDRGEVATRITRLVRTHRRDPRTASTVMIVMAPTDEGHTLTLEYERTLLDAGRTLSPLRPKAATFEYSIPFGWLATNFQIEARALFDSIALRERGAARSVRREGDRLASCGDANIFAIRGRELLAPAPESGAIDSVERELVIAAAAKAHLDVRHEPVLHSELKSFDELFFADAAGITALAECDGAKFMSLAVVRLAAGMSDL